MIQLICFDLDGTLIESKEIHYLALNKALAKYAPEFVISHHDHLAIFDGLPTKTKLQMLVKRGMPEEVCDDINRYKQEVTQEIMQTYDFGVDYVDLMSYLSRNRWCQLALCTNSIRSTTNLILKRLDLQDVFDIVLTNEHVRNPKPDPEMYLMAMDLADVTPDRTLIIEDSEKGIAAAKASGAHVFSVDNPSQVTRQNIQSLLDLL